MLGKYAGMEPQPGTSDLPAQVEVLRSLIRDGSGQRRIDALLLQVGINDLDFSDIIVACAGNRDVNAGSVHCMYDTGFRRS